MTDDAIRIRISSGNMTYTGDGFLTIADISKLAEAAELIGVPADAIIGDIRVQQNWSNSGRQGTEVQVNWRLPDKAGKDQVVRLPRL